MEGSFERTKHVPIQIRSPRHECSIKYNSLRKTLTRQCSSCGTTCPVRGRSWCTYPHANIDAFASMSGHTGPVTLNKILYAPARSRTSPQALDLSGAQGGDVLYHYPQGYPEACNRATDFQPRCNKTYYEGVSKSNGIPRVRPLPTRKLGIVQRSPRSASLYPRATQHDKLTHSLIHLQQSLWERCVGDRSAAASCVHTADYPTRKDCASRLRPNRDD
jgi:hypothetical protein